MLANEQFVDCNKNLWCCIIGLPRYPWWFCPHLAKNKGRKVPTLYNSVLSEVCTAVTRVARHLSQCFDWSLASFDQSRQMLNRQNRCKTGRCSASSLSQSPDLFSKTSYAYGSVSVTTDNGVLPSRVLVNFFFPLLLWASKSFTTILCSWPNSPVFLSLFMQISAMSLTSQLAWKGVRLMARWTRFPTGRRRSRPSG